MQFHAKYPLFDSQSDRGFTFSYVILLCIHSRVGHLLFALVLRILDSQRSCAAWGFQNGGYGFQLRGAPRRNHSAETNKRIAKQIPVSLFLKRPAQYSAKYSCMSSWAGFTDEELNRLRQQHGVEDGRVPQENIKKAGINNAKRQRARKKIRTRAPHLEQKPSWFRSQENQSENRKNIDSLGVGNASAAANKATSFRARVDSRDEEGENSSPECERRVKNKQKKEIVMVEEALSTPKHEGGLCEDGTQRKQAEEKGIEKKLSDDLPAVIEENDKYVKAQLTVTFITDLFLLK